MKPNKKKKLKKKKDFDPAKEEGRRNGQKKKQEGESENIDKSSTKDPVDNDISWYSRYPNLLSAAARIPFAKYPGSGITVSGVDTTIPGVLALDYYPSIGISTSDHSAPSQLALELYARVRANYSGELEADGPDIVMYIMSLANVYMYISWCKRVYRTLNSFSPINYNMPNLLLQSYGLSGAAINKLRTQKTEFWGYINQLIAEARTFKVPDEFDVLRRYVWLCDNVFKDTEELSQAQLYVFNPRGFYVFAEQNTPDGIAASGLEMQAMPFDPTISPDFTSNPGGALFAYGQGLITALKSWSTSSTINGYLQRAFKDSPWFTMEEVFESDLQVPEYSEEVLGQIENFHGLCIRQDNVITADQVGLAVSQDPKTNAVLCASQVTVKGTAIEMLDVVNTLQMNLRREDDPSEVVINSRMIGYVTKASHSAGQMLYTVDCATELPLGMRYLNAGDVSNDTINSGTFIPPIYSLSGGIGSSLLVAPCALESFDWHPFVYVVTNTGGDTPTVDSVAILGDIHTYASVSPQSMRRLHEICLYSEYNAFSLI